MKKRLPRTVVVLGFVSLLNDLASEMVTPLIPILLMTVLSAGPAVIGLIEGVADALASFLKLWSGRRSDRLGGRRKALTLSGYVLSNCARPLLSFAGSWTTVLLLRSLDRIGKGVRSAPRDALVVDTTPAEMRGYAFGFHRAMDNGGAVAGSLVAAAALAWFTDALTQVILGSALPGALVVLLLIFGVRDDAALPRTAPAIGPLRWQALSLLMRRYLLVLAVFTLGRASEMFILLRGHELGMSIVQLLLLWAGLNLAKSLAAVWGGHRADHVGRVKLLLAGWGAFSVSFLALGQVTQVAFLCVVAMVYGLFAGLTEGVERAQISDFAASQERATAFGWYYLIEGLAAIPGGLLFGAVWQMFGAAAAFGLAAIWTATAVLLLHFWARLPLTVKAHS